MNQKNFSAAISVIFGAAILAFLTAFYVLAWVEPSQSPPLANVPAPLNVGPMGQQKLFSSVGTTTAGQFGVSIPSGESFDPNYIFTAGTQTTYNSGLKGIKVAGDSLFEYGTTTVDNLIISNGGDLTLNNQPITSWSEVAASGYWKLSSSNLTASDTSWNVGIGTTTPTHKLEVAGDVSLEGNRIVNLAAPVDGNDAATKDWVLAQSSGGGSLTLISKYNADSAPDCPDGWTKEMTGYWNEPFRAYNSNDGSNVGKGPGGGGFCGPSPEYNFGNYDKNFWVQYLGYYVYNSDKRYTRCTICIK